MRVTGCRRDGCVNLNPDVITMDVWDAGYEWHQCRETDNG